MATSAVTVQYVVPGPDGKLYGPFTTNDASANANTNDAQYWANQKNLASAPVHILLSPSSYVAPIPEADTTG